MKPHVIALRLTAVSVLFLTAGSTLAGESLTYDSNTGIYTVEYYNTYDQPTPVQQRAQFELRTRIEPSVKSKVKENGSGKDLLIYQYEIKNGTASKQHIGVIRLVGSQAYDADFAVPNGWSRSIVPRITTSEIIVGWSPISDQGGLRPGVTQQGFGFESRDLPGVGVLESIGRARRDLGGFPDLGPSPDTPVGKQLSDLMKANESVPRFAAIPKIAMPDSFNAESILVGVQQHLRNDLSRYQLVDSVFASQLDQLLQAAIDAAGRGNTAGLKANLKDLRQMLKKEHGDVDKDDDYAESDPDKVKNRQVLIDKLAAKVLDFDFKYVEKRLK